jgi:hypothetical protein
MGGDSLCPANKHTGTRRNTAGRGTIGFRARGTGGAVCFRACSFRARSFCARGTSGIAAGLAADRPSG